MSVSLHHIVIDAHDLPGLARFWSQALDWPILSEREREVVIGPANDAPVGICFMPTPDDKIVKNRVHLDLNPGPDASAVEREAEIERLIALGARPVEIGQRGDETWTVLADPEGKVHKAPTKLDRRRTAAIGGAAVWPSSLSAERATPLCRSPSRRAAMRLRRARKVGAVSQRVESVRRRTRLVTTRTGVSVTNIHRICVAGVVVGGIVFTAGSVDASTPEPPDPELAAEQAFITESAPTFGTLSTPACSVDPSGAPITCFGITDDLSVVVGIAKPNESFTFTEYSLLVPTSVAPVVESPTTTQPPVEQEPTTTAEAAVPAEYQNALRSAESYLDFTAFSQQGLIEQLEFEGYSTEAAQWAVENVDVDWNEQAALKAAEYLDFQAFSESGLRDQLEFEGFTPEQINFAISEMKAQGRL